MPFAPPLQTNSGNGGGVNPWILAFPSPVTAGNLLIVFGSVTGPGTASGPPTDTLGNSYINLINQPDLSGASADLWYCFSKASGANTVTFPSFVNSIGIAIIAEYPIQGTLDQVQSPAGGASGLCGPITTTQGSELLIAVNANGLQPSTWTATNGFTVRVTANGSAPQPTSLVLVDKIVSVIGTYSTTLTPTNLFSQEGGIVSFFQAANPTKLEISLFGVKRFGKQAEQECTEMATPRKPARLFEID